jgi:N,N'-diacetyllegionaminate synthase
MKMMGPSRFEIDGRGVGTGEPCFVVGEVAQAHDGSLGLAHAFIDAIADAGADAVKFQTHIAGAESTPMEPWRKKFSLQDMTRYEYWMRMEFTEEQWYGLKRHANEKGLVFLSSPFSIEAVELLERVGSSAWKVASGEVSNIPMLERMLLTGLPILLSTGMSPLEEIDSAVQRVQNYKLPLAVLQCTTAYPCPSEKIGLNMIPFYRDRYGCAVGFSDHSGTIYAGLAAAAVGIDILEVHVSFSREMFGPDVPASVTTAELRQLIEGLRFIEKMKTAEVDKDAMALEMKPLRDVFTKSVVTKAGLAAGAIIREQDLALKKPGTGIPAARLRELIGRQLKRDMKADEFIREEDLESTE